MILDLGDGFTSLVDDDCLDLLDGRTVRLGFNGYAYVGRGTTLHALVMGGSRPGFHIDHINGDKLDNRRANLRFVTYQQNQINRRSANRNSSSGVRGVQRLGVKWRAQITANRTNHHIGCFDTLEEAVAARRAAELHYFGETCS